MEERLGLSAEQAQQFERIRNEHFSRARPLQDEMHKIRLDILDEMFAPEPDQTRIQSLLAELSSKQNQFNKYLFAHFQELKDACNGEQVKELKIMLRDLIESTRPREPGHHRPGQPGDLRPGQPGDFGPGHRPPPDR